LKPASGKGLEDPILIKPIKKRASRVVQGVGPEIKPQYHKNIKNKIKIKCEKRGKMVRRNIKLK
jgi:hypothetical protein